MLFESLCENKNVVQIDYNYAFQNEIFKDIIHYCLKGGRTICETEEYDEGFIKAVIGSKGGLSLIILFHLGFIEISLNIQFYEILGSLKLGN